jgi:hypothetical protein
MPPQQQPNTDENARFHGLGMGTTRKSAFVFRSDTGRRGNHHDMSTFPRLHDTRATYETVLNTNQRPCCQGPRHPHLATPTASDVQAPLGRALVDHALTHGGSGRSRTHQMRWCRTRTGTSRPRTEFLPLLPHEEPGS